MGMFDSTNAITLLVRARAADSTKYMKTERVHALKGLVLPRSSHYGEITLAGSRHLRSTLAAAPALFAHAVTTAAKNRASATPN